MRGWPGLPSTGIGCPVRIAMVITGVVRRHARQIPASAGRAGFLGLDVAKGERHATAVTPTGKKAFEKQLPKKRA
ncbi:hypothetical protein ACIBL8_47215 [Streptomyces sp. NPDC050523]|uniref:hypothetical protein n=1 Tax=Streptomyces sp. NPDC050523 TaxID=3365622 RepID=UPI0037BCC40C